MMQSKRVWVLWVAVLVLLMGVLSSLEKVYGAEATKYPERDIVCIVPAVPGGGFDVISRAAAPYLRKYLPKPVNVIVQNIPAAGGRVGAYQIYDAKPDGYTFGIVDPMIFVVAEAMRELGKRDIMHMTWLPKVSSHPYAMAVSPQSPIQKIEDLKRKKGQKVYASASQFTIACTVIFLRFLGVEPQVVIYGGGAESCLAAMRGDVDLVIQVGGTVLRQAEASGGKLIPLAVFSEKRLDVAPNVPTAKELGLDIPPEIMLFLTYNYVFTAPYGLPADVQKTLNEAILKTLQDPAFVEQLNRAKLTVDFVPPEEVRKEIAGFSKVVPQYIEAVRQALPK